MSEKLPQEKKYHEIETVLASGNAHTGEWDSLTPAELRVVVLVAEGLTNIRIAQHLCLSRYTVETHLKHVFIKLHVTSRAAVAAEAVRRGASVTRHNSPSNDTKRIPNT